MAVVSQHPHGRKQGSRRLAVWLFVLGLFGLCCTQNAWAQETPPTPRSSTAFDVQQFRPTADPNGTFQTVSAKTLGQWGFFIGAFFHYSWDPLFLVEEGKDGQIDVIRHQLSVDINIGLGLFSWLDVSATVPMNIFQDGELPTISRLEPVAGRALTGFYMRDVQVRLRFRILDEAKYGVSLGIMPSVGIPSGSSDHFSGEGTVSFGLKALLSKEISIVRFALNFGYRYLDETEFLGLFVGHELTYGVGLGIEAVANKFMLIADLSGTIGLTAPGIASSPMGLYVGARLFPIGNKTLALNVGVGIGLLSGYGSPKFRFMFGFAWSPQFGRARRPARPAKDQDRDGVLDAQDRCPRTPGPRSNRGCPVRDSDFDGVPDNQDRCPKKAGDKSNQGCPAKDTDGDGVPDHKDRCPKEVGPVVSQGCPVANDKDGDGLADNNDLCPTIAGVAGNRGCPKPRAGDKDGDGVFDGRDRCPTQPGGSANQGCPKGVTPPPKPGRTPPPVGRREPAPPQPVATNDRDNDGINDNKDRCPDLKGSRRRRGCPRRVYVVVSLRRKRIFLRKLITFYRRTRLRRRSRAILRQVAQILRSRPTMKIRIVGLTFSRSRRRWVRGLALRRARSVYRYLRRLKIPKSRLSYRGYRRYWRRRYTRSFIRIYIRQP